MPRFAVMKPLFSSRSAKIHRQSFKEPALGMRSLLLSSVMNGHTFLRASALSPGHLGTRLPRTAVLLRVKLDSASNVFSLIAQACPYA